MDKHDSRDLRFFQVTVYISSMNTLTPRQQQILTLIREHISTQGCPPTRAEIARQLGFRSPNAAESHLKALARKGVIELAGGTNRNIRLMDNLEVDTGLPVIGRVAAGSPMLAEAHIERHCQIDPQLFHPVPDYLLRVKGMSMQNAGIHDGDLLAVHRTPDATEGTIVVARLDNEVTVKRLVRRQGRLYLLPENPDFSPIPVPVYGDAFAIEGIVVGVIRTGGF